MQEILKYMYKNISCLPLPASRGYISLLPRFKTRFYVHLLIVHACSKVKYIFCCYEIGRSRKQRFYIGSLENIRLITKLPGGRNNLIFYSK